LASVEASAQWFREVVISVNGPPGSDDDRAARAAAARTPGITVITTGVEMDWTRHQYFWLAHLERSGMSPDDWLYWFAHDDEVRPTGIAQIVDADGNWPLRAGTVYMGPWAMRHEGNDDAVFSGPRDVPLESWTSFPLAGPLRLPVAEWIRQQLVQPTYINMSGAIVTLRFLQDLRDFPFHKPGGTRIEMVAAAAKHHAFVEEFSEPVVITFGRPNSARTQFDRVARLDDLHLLAWMAPHLLRHPDGVGPTLRGLGSVAGSYVRVLTKRGTLPAEEWRMRAVVDP
jgi:hypothetical protein